MRFFEKGPDGTERPVGVYSLNSAQVTQASAVTDCLGRMIPHEGVDYEIQETEDSFWIRPLTDKGEAWEDYVSNALSMLPGETPVESRGDFVLLLGKMIPVDGVDYDPQVVYSGGSKVSLRVR